MSFVPFSTTGLHEKMRSIGVWPAGPALWSGALTRILYLFADLRSHGKNIIIFVIKYASTDDSVIPELLASQCESRIAWYLCP